MGNGRKPAARQIDMGSDHHGYPPTPVIAGSADVTIDGLPVARQGDALVPHDKPHSSSHPRSVAGGAGSVRINGLPAGRAGDPVDCGGKLIGGSPTVFIGDGPGSGNPVTPAEWQAVMGRLTGGRTAPATPRARQELAAAEAVRFRGREGGAASWSEYYAEGLRRAAQRGDPPPAPGSDASSEEMAGYDRAMAEMRAIKRQDSAFRRFQKAWLVNAAWRMPGGWEHRREVPALLGRFSGAEGNRLATALDAAERDAVHLGHDGPEGTPKPIRPIDGPAGPAPAVVDRDVAAVSRPAH